MKVRPARRADARRIAEISVRGWQEGYRDLMPTDYLASLSIDQREARWLSHEPDVEREALVCEDRGAICGFAVLGPSRDAGAPASLGELRALYVDPATWRRGCGRALWSEVELRLCGRAFEAAMLWVLAGNTRARLFYESRGFVVDPGSERPFEVGDFSLPELRYRRAL